MINVHAVVLLPPVMNPVHESFKGQLLRIAVVRPPIIEGKLSRFASQGACAKQILQSA